jgi:Zn-dependent metalloprotease/PKD repeat protein
MKFLTLMLAASLASSQLIAQNIESKQNPVIIQKVFLEETTSIPTFIKFDKLSAPSVFELDLVLMPYLKGKNNLGLRLLRTEQDNLGMVHYRYIQTYKGIDIEFAELMVHTMNDQILSINGKLVDNNLNQGASSYTEQMALDRAMNAIGAKSYKWQLPSEEAFIKAEKGDENATFFPKGDLVYINPTMRYNVDGFKKAYRFNIYAHEPMSRTEIYVDVNNGSILFRNNLIHTANVQGTATTAYSGQRTINTDSTAPGNYRLNQTISGNGINTYNLNLTNNYGSATDFIDADNIWNNVNAQKDQYATDAHWGAEMTYDYFFNQHNRNSINNAGFALNSYIHSSDPQSGSTTYANAFWDGSRMTYGDGNSNFNPLVALDIAGHEITHGLTSNTANLVYASESGALNESFSDIFGSAIEFYSRPTNSNWLVGEDIGNALRSMSNPRQYGDPDTRLGPSWTNVIGCSPSNNNDQCGVHSNSGVQNKWFYLLSVGGTGTNGISNAYNVSGISIDSAAAIAFRNLTVYLGRNSNYDDARFFAIESAKDLFGDCSPQVASTTDAWFAVGVGPAYVPYALSDFEVPYNKSCSAPFQVVFNNNSINGNTYFWDFGDGSTSAARIPQHTYQTYGKFDVKLVIDGGACGIDSLERTNYIDVDSTFLCKAILKDGNNGIETSCLGRIYDSGDSLNHYSDNETGIMTIAPNGAATVSLLFAFFDVEAGTTANLCDYDFLEVFDGPSVNSTIIGSFCNSANKLPPSLITSTGSSITLRFTTDGGLTMPGFQIDWSCNYPSSAPSSDFLTDNANSCRGEVYFHDLSTNVPSAWNWSFGDGNTSNVQHPSHNYSSNGTYNVQLITTNGFGSDTILKNSVAVVNRPVSPSVQDSTFCLNQPISLNANGTGTIRWYQQASGGNPIAIANNLNVTAINVDTSFWVEDFIESPLQSVGPVSNTIGSGNNFNNDQNLFFDVFQPIILKRVTVYSGASSTRAIELRDGNGIVLQTKYIYIPSGTQFVNLDLEIQPGTGYQLGLAQGSNIDLFRNNAGVSYPYNLPGLVSITGSSASSNGFYYFFYNWQVKEIDCISPRVEVKAFVDSTCTITSIRDNYRSKESISLYPNPSNSKVFIDLKGLDETVKIQVFNVEGKLILEKDKLSSSIKLFEFDLSGNKEGIYFVKILSSTVNITRPIVFIK